LNSRCKRDYSTGVNPVKRKFDEINPPEASSLESSGF